MLEPSDVLIVTVCVHVCVCSDTGDMGGTVSSDCDSQRSSVSYEEGTYDGRQGSVTYSCRDDEAMMKSAASGTAAAAAAAGASASVMHDERYQQPYVISLLCLLLRVALSDLSVHTRQAENHLVLVIILIITIYIIFSDGV